MISKKKLWETQVREYPSSVRLTIEEVYKWCDEAPNKRYMQIALALQWPNVVFYRIEGTQYRGFRFGLHGSEYVSLYAG